MLSISHGPILILIDQLIIIDCVPVKSKLEHPPGHLNFWKIFVQIPSSPGRKVVQMPHPRDNH